MEIKNRYEQTGKNIDYLEVKLFWDDIKTKLSWLTENSTTRSIKTPYYKWIIQYRATFQAGQYIIYDLYISEIEGKKLEQWKKIWSINNIKRKDTPKNWVFLTLSGEFWNEFDILVFMDFINWIDYNYNKYMWAVYRLDFKIDIKDISVQTIYDNLDFKKIESHNIRMVKTWKDEKKLTYFKLEFTEDLLRVYDKKLDILDKQKEGYEDYLKTSKDITRVELQLSRKKFAKKLIKDIFDIFEYWEDALVRKIRRYFVYEFDYAKKLNWIKFNITKDEIQEREKKKFNFSKIMFEAYIKKLLDNKRWKKYLKNKIIELEKDLLQFK